jgi:hypothetical protein
VSKGPGIQQRRILAALAGRQMVPLSGDTRAETTALLRAAKGLERAGRCVIVRLWDDGRTKVSSYAFPPDFTVNGRPVRELSVDRVSSGTGSTFRGSIRQIAAEAGVSATTIFRDLRQMGERPGGRG